MKSCSCSACERVREEAVRVIVIGRIFSNQLDLARIESDVDNEHEHEHEHESHTEHPTPQPVSKLAQDVWRSR